MHRSTTLYNRHVVSPSNFDGLVDCESESKTAVFSGCIGSIDVAHVAMDRCSYRLRQLHLGYKLTHTARTYNLTVDHKRRILSTTDGHPACFNDKSFILFDEFVNSLK